jgi:hypothetical protein
MAAGKGVRGCDWVALAAGKGVRGCDWVAMAAGKAGKALVQRQESLQWKYDAPVARKSSP